MTELVIVPAWRRPDFLHATLTRLQVADDGRQQYWLCLDRRHSPDVAQVATNFARRFGDRTRLIARAAHRYRGNSFNILAAYRDAYATPGVELVHLVEEDVFVAADYFAFHRQAHAAAGERVFAVSACRNQIFPGDPPPGDDALYTYPSYQSLGVSFHPGRLQLLMPHLQPAYFANPGWYCSRTFPASRIPAGNAEQDGLINRIVEAGGWQLAYPCTPRAYHAGFTGYHRDGRALSGSVEDRAGQLLAMTGEQLNAHAYTYPDHHTIPLDAPRAAIARLVTWPPDTPPLAAMLPPAVGVAAVERRLHDPHRQRHRQLLTYLQRRRAPEAGAP